MDDSVTSWIKKRNVSFLLCSNLPNTRESPENRPAVIKNKIVTVTTPSSKISIKDNIEINFSQA